MLYIEEKPFQKASEFIDYLRLSHNHWKVNEDDSGFQMDWYFRGQMDSTLPLKPKTLRSAPYDDKFIKIMSEKYFDKELLATMDEIIKKFISNKDNSDKSQENVEKVLHIAMAEMLLIDEFVKLSQRALGIAIPSIDIWNQCVDKFTKNPMGLFFDYDRKEFWQHPALVIAQHHGIPTRLLDWTSNPIKAALFAVSFEPLETTQKLGVYAFHRLHFDKGEVVLYHPPLSVTSFLHAQEGLFTLDMNSTGFFLKYGRFPSIDETLTSNQALSNVPKALLITLPTTERFELFRQLWLENYTNAHLMPTLDNVAKAVKLKLEAMSKRN